MEIDSDTQVYFELSDAYSFRSLIEYLSLTNDEGNFTFTSTEIRYSRKNDSSQVLNDIVIYPHELTYYYYNGETEETVVGVNMRFMKSATKKIGKKDLAIISISKDNFYIQVLGPPKNTSDNNIDATRTKTIEKVIYQMDQFQDETQPNCVIGIQRFSSACSDLFSCKCEFITLIGTDSGLVMEGKQSGNLRSNIKTFGSITSASESEKASKIGGKMLKMISRHPGEIIRHQIPSSIITSLSKLVNISPNGTVKCYFQPNNPIKFSLHISTYGKLDIYLRQGKIIGK